MPDNVKWCKRFAGIFWIFWAIRRNFTLTFASRIVTLSPDNYNVTCVFLLAFVWII